MRKLISKNPQSNQKSNKLIWAIDPTQNPADAKNIVIELKTWAKHLKCEILPVTIISKSIMNLPFDIGLPWRDTFVPSMEKAVDLYLKKTNLKDHLPPELLFIPWISTRKMADALTQFAKKQKALIIFAHTRAKSTRSPVRFGGFTEALITSSHIPVLLLNPNSLPSALPTSKDPSILFPTDFTRQSKTFLTKIQPWAKSLNAKIILYNQLETPYIYPTDYNDNWHYLTVNVVTMMSEIEKSRIHKAKLWAADLLKHHTKCTTLINRQKRDLVTDILQTAKQNKANLIAMVSHSGPIAELVIGSIAHDVLLQAKCPMIISHDSL